MTSIQLTPKERNALRDHNRRVADPEVRLRPHILLQFDAGHSWVTTCSVLFCPTSTVSRWKQRFEAEGVDPILGRTRGRQWSGVHI
jgi:hypothetical protein